MHIVYYVYNISTYDDYYRRLSRRFVFVLATYYYYYYYYYYYWVRVYQPWPVLSGWFATAAQSTGNAYVIIYNILYGNRAVIKTKTY